MTPTEKLARAMGYETRTESPGYGNTVVLIQVGVLKGWQVFNPRADGLQFAEVLAWLLRQSPTFDDSMMVDHACVACLKFDDEGDSWRYWWIDHNGTGPDLMRAVCDAAERVADGMANGD